MARGLLKPLIILLEKGVEAKGILREYEYISFDRSNPTEAYSRAVDYVRKELENRLNLAFLIVALVAIIATVLGLAEK